MKILKIEKKPNFSLSKKTVSKLENNNLSHFLGGNIDAEQSWSWLTVCSWVKRCNSGNCGEV